MPYAEASKKYLGKNEGSHWKFGVNEIQQNHGMKLANKLSKNHITYETHHMKVDLGDSRKGFKISRQRTTATFARIVDKLFHMLNSRNLIGKESKQPLKLVNKVHWEAELITIAIYLLLSKPGDDQLLNAYHPQVKTLRKTFILGFVNSIKSTVEMTTTMLTD